MRMAGPHQERVGAMAEAAMTVAAMAVAATALVAMAAAAMEVTLMVAVSVAGRQWPYHAAMVVGRWRWRRWW